jgi:hypothetical protein
LKKRPGVRLLAWRRGRRVALRGQSTNGVFSILFGQPQSSAPRLTAMSFEECVRKSRRAPARRKTRSNRGPPSPPATSPWLLLQILLQMTAPFVASGPFKRRASQELLEQIRESLSLRQLVQPGCQNAFNGAVSAMSILCAAEAASALTQT